MLYRQQYAKHPTIVPPLEPATLTYVEHLEKLTGELHKAMEAMGENRLSALEESVWRQESLCCELGHLSAEYTQEQLASLEANHPDSLLRARAKAAEASLAILNQRYAALLRHSKESMRLFAGLYRNFEAQSAKEPHGDRSRTGMDTVSWGVYMRLGGGESWVD